MKIDYRGWSWFIEEPVSELKSDCTPQPFSYEVG